MRWNRDVRSKLDVSVAARTADKLSMPTVS
jgi:hypothetical protein